MSTGFVRSRHTTIETLWNL